MSSLTQLKVNSYYFELRWEKESFNSKQQAKTEVEHLLYVLILTIEIPSTSNTFLVVWITSANSTSRSSKRKQGGATDLVSFEFEQKSTRRRMAFLSDFHDDLPPSRLSD